MTEKVLNVMMSLKPKWHQIAALAVLRRFLGVAIARLEFWKETNQPPQETVGRWLEDGLLPIDLGSNWYKQRNGLGSAIDVIVADFEIPASPALDALQEMAARNNNDGYLRNQPGSIVRLLREMYKLGWSQEEVVEVVIPTIDIFLDAFGANKVKDEAEKLSRLVPNDQLRESMALFTIGSYTRDMIRLDISEKEIAERIAVLLAGWRKDRMAKNRGDGKVQARLDYKVDVRFSLGDGVMGVAITTDDREIARGILQSDSLNVSLAIIRNGTGHATIKVRGRGKKLFNLAAALNSLETGRWFFDERFPYIVNRPPVKATGLTSEELASLVRQHIRF